MSTNPNISQIMPVSLKAIEDIQKGVQSQSAMQVESEDDLNQYFDIGIFSPMAVAQRSRTIHELAAKKEAEETEEAEEVAEIVEQILDTEAIDSTAQRYTRNNYELNAKTLKILRGQLAKSDSPDEIIEKVTEVYGDAALADEAMDFLLETTEGQLLAATQEAKEKFRKDRGKEIRAGRNMGTAAREFSKEGLGSPSSLRDLYRDLTSNPREPLKLFDELTEKFRYEKLKIVLTFLLHSLGADLKSKGPSIERGELQRLLGETRSLQGIFHLFRFFQSRMKLIQMGFSSRKLQVPAQLNFEILSRMFVKILQERFMNPEKILQTARLLGMGEEKAAQVIVYSQMLDAITQVAPRYFRDRRHKDELTKSFLDTIKNLEEKIKEEEEEKK